MPTVATPSPQLDLFVRDTPAYQKALARYDLLRPILQGQSTLVQQSRATGMPYHRLWQDLRRFQRAGIVGLLDRRTLPHARGKAPIEARVPPDIQQQVVRLALAHPFTTRELARIVQTCHAIAIDHRGIQRVLDVHQLTPEVLRLHHQATPRTPLPPLPSGQQLDLGLEPTTRAQRLLHALGPDHLLVRFRTYHEYPTAEQARWRIIELLEVGFRPRRVAHLLAIQPAVVYYWSRRFEAFGLEGLTTRTRVETPITTRVSVQAMMDVFQLLDNNPLLGHYRVKMALDALGYRYGHTTVWQMVALYKQAHPRLPQASRPPNPAEQPLSATAPHQVWFADLRYLVKIDGQWLYSILIFDGYSRAIVGAGCFDRQNLSRLAHVFRQAITQWGAPDTVVSDHGAVFLALRPCLAQLDIRWTPITKGHPWQNLAEGGFSIQRRMLDAYLMGCTQRETAYRQHMRFVRDYQFWGHWAHKHTDAQGRIYYLSPEVVLGNARGRGIEPARLKRVFRLRHVTRTVRRQGQIRLHNFGVYVDRELWGHTVEILIYDDMLRIERAEHVLVTYPCDYDTRQRRITVIDDAQRYQYHRVQVSQLVLFALEIARTVWRMPLYRRAEGPHQAVQARQMSLSGLFRN
jgi:Integrase core domain/Homeodomain-like domain